MKLANIFKPKWKNSDPKVRIKSIGLLNPENTIDKEERNKNEPILVKIAKYDNDAEVRKEAVRYIKDQIILKEIALNENNIDVFTTVFEKLSSFQDKKDVIKKINNPLFISYVAKNSTSDIIRNYAVEKVKDQDTLYDIFQEEKQINIKQTALYNFTNQHILFDIAASNPDRKIRWSAIFSIKDENLLMKIYEIEKDSQNRETIVSKLTSQNDLARIVAEDLEISVINEAISKLSKLDKSKWQNFFYELFNNVKNHISVRLNALDKLFIEKWQDMFYEVVKNNKEDLSIRVAAIERLHKHQREDFLYEIIQTSQYPLLRINAIIKLIPIHPEKSDRFFQMINKIIHSEEESEVKNVAKKIDYDFKILATLRNLCTAYTMNDKSKISGLEPKAKVIGRELNSVGGIEEMRRIFNKLGGIPGQRTLEMLWDGIGEWRG
ncbi:MAG: hypothetical protein FJW56_10410 [Actinobacteria bacterium]|nr:hypothetical protein [Actinomycetota bacterium]